MASYSNCFTAVGLSLVYTGLAVKYLGLMAIKLVKIILTFKWRWVPIATSV